MAKTQKKSKPGNKLRYLILVALLIAGVFGIWGIVEYLSAPSAKKGPSNELAYKTICLEAAGNDCAVSMEIADDNQKRVKGLSGRTSMPVDQGMIFAFDEPEGQCFWMKEMQFSLDIIWLNDKKEVIQINKNVPPESYPENFCSVEPVKYVIEVNSGVAESLGLESGKTLTF